MIKNDYFIGSLLRISTFIFLFSRGCLYIIFDSPYRALLWREELFRPFVELFGSNWQHYADTSNPGIAVLEKSIGFFFIFASFCALRIKSSKAQKFMSTSIAGAGIFTCFHIFLKYLGHDHELPIVAEYILQGLTPFLFLAYLKLMPDGKGDKWKNPSSLLFFCSKVIIALCFLGHGLYAAGWPYQPAHFVRMLSTSIFVDFDTATILVTCIGFFDIFLAIIIFIKPLEKLALGHMAFWGFATAMARLISYVIVPMKMDNLNPWFFESSVRFIHGAMPLFLFLLLSRVRPPNLHFSDIKETLFCKKYIYSALAAFIIFSSLGAFIFANQPQVPIVASTIHAPVKVPSSLQMSDFRQSSTGRWISDTVFANDNFPVRFILLEDGKNDELFEETFNKFKPLFNKRQTIIKKVNKRLIKSFRISADSDQKLSEQQILLFIKKVLLTFNNDQSLHVHMDIPWNDSGSIDFEIMPENLNSP